MKCQKSKIHQKSKISECAQKRKTFLTFEHVRKDRRSFQTKAQMEMLGLALVVMLISVAMLFVVKFMVFEKPEEIKTDYTETELASNFISTLLETTVPTCRDLTFTEILQDVATSHVNTNCDPGYGTTSDALEKNLTYILINTFEKWNIGYELNASTQSNLRTETHHLSGNCPGARTQRQFPIPVDASGAIVLDVTLSICSKQYE